MTDDLEGDIKVLTGEHTNVLIASRKGPSIGGKVVKNSELCESDSLAGTPSNGQRCGACGCKCCPLICGNGESLTVNGTVVTPKLGATCKTRNVIYVAQCQLCEQAIDNSYGGQTVQPFHKHVNGHRANFKPDDLSMIEKSAHFQNIILSNIQ